MTEIGAPSDFKYIQHARNAADRILGVVRSNGTEKDTMKRFVFETESSQKIFNSL